MDGHRLTRRQALRLGAGAAALGALRLPATAHAASENGPALFELPVRDSAARAAAARWRTTKVLQAPRRFDLLGLTWARGHLDAQVRARREGGRWTRWTPLPHSHGGDQDRTDPVFTGTADELQLRLRGSARDLKVRFVRALPHAPAAAPRARASQGNAPAILPRESWGGDRVPPRGTPDYGAVQVAFVHHTVTAVDYAPEEAPAIVLGIARYHRDSNGWNDIGYNFLVDRYGVIYEGRAGGIDQAVIGAQAQGYNSFSTGIACLGTFTNLPFDAPAMDALARLIGWKLSLHAVPVQGQVTLLSGGGAANRYPSGTPVTFERISGHRDGDTTSCPGEALYAQLPELRARAANYDFAINGITVRATRQRGTKPVTVSGALRFADGSSPAGAPLGVEYMAAGSAWTQLTTTTCGPDGRWTAEAVLPATGRVRAVFAGDATRPRLESDPVTVRVVPSMALTTDKRRAKAGRSFSVSGTLDPAPDPRVVCLLERKVGRRWVRVQRKRINVRGGRFRTRVRPTRPGLYRVSIIADGVTRRRTLRALH